MDGTTSFQSFWLNPERAARPACREETIDASYLFRAREPAGKIWRTLKTIEKTPQGGNADLRYPDTPLLVLNLQHYGERAAHFTLSENGKPSVLAVVAVGSYPSQALDLGDLGDDGGNALAEVAGETLQRDAIKAMQTAVQAIIGPAAAKRLLRHLKLRDQASLTVVPLSTGSKGTAHPVLTASVLVACAFFAASGDVMATGW